MDRPPNLPEAQKTARPRLGRRHRALAGFIATATWTLALAIPASAEPIPTSIPTTTSTVVPGAPDEIKVDPTWGTAPGKDKVQMLLDFLSQAGLYCCLAAIILGGAIMSLGKMIGSAQGNRGVPLVLGGGGGAIIVILAPGIINWLVK